MDALLDAPAELEAPEISADEPLESTDVADTPVDPNEATETERTPEQIEADNKLPLWKQAKNDLDKMENKGLAGKIKDALFRDQQLAKDLPEGIKGAVALRNEVAGLAQSLGDPAYRAQSPAQVVADVKSQLGYFHELDGLFTKGDPSFAMKLAEASPESFQKLAPAVFAEFSKQNPDGYASYVAHAVDSYLEKGGISIEFAVLREFFPLMPDFTGKARVEAAFEKIFGLTQDLKDMAKKPITAPEKKPDDAAIIEQQRQELATQQLDVQRQSWNNDATRYGNDLMGKEITRLSGKNAVTDDQRRQIVSKVAEELDARLTANKAYGEAMRGFLQSKDQEGYKRRLHSEYQKLIPSAVSRAYADVVTSKPKLAVVQKPVAAVAGAKPTRNEGWRPVSKYPVGLVDMVATPRKDYEAGRYILKDGSKVSFNRRQA